MRICFKVNACFFKLLSKPIAALTCCVKEYSVVILILIEDNAKHCIVDRLCTKASAH